MPRLSPHIPPLPALKAFEAVARLGSLSRAAEELNVTKSAISHQLRALESALGTTLMHRGGTTSRAQPTSAGQELLAAIESSLIPLGEACERFTLRRRKRRRTLTVSANAPFSSLWLAPHVVEFSTRHPEIAVNLRVFDDEPDWQNDAIDIAIPPQGGLQPLTYRLVSSSFIDGARHAAAGELDQLHEQDNHHNGEDHGVGLEAEVSIADCKVAN